MAKLTGDVKAFILNPMGKRKKREAKEKNPALQHIGKLLRGLSPKSFTDRK